MTQITAASERQVAFIRDLASEVLGSNTLGAQFVADLEARGGLQTRALTSSVIDDLIKRRTIARAERRRPAADAPAEAGMYRTADGTIYKVQKAVHGSGNLYAKRLVPPAEFGGRAEFVYAPGAIRTLTAADKMTLEQAKEFGALYGTCCVCGRTLTDERSIEAGIGPVCAGRL